MVGTIAPVGYRDMPFGKLHWLLSALFYTLGATVGGGLTGASLAYLSGLALNPFILNESHIPSITGLLAVFYALHEMDIASLPHPQRRKQVPSKWRHRFHPYLTTCLYGLMLGTGLLTYIPTASYFILVFAAAVSGSPATGALILSVYGAARALLLWPSSLVVTNVERWDTLTSYVNLTKPIMRLVNGFGLALVGVGLILGA